MLDLKQIKDSHISFYALIVLITFRTNFILDIVVLSLENWNLVSFVHIWARHLTFLSGRGGIYALGAVAANYCGDQQKRDSYLDRFLEVSIIIFFFFLGMVV